MSAPDAPAPLVPGPVIHRAGDTALLIDLPDLAHVVAWHAHLDAHPLAGQSELVAGATTLLVRFTNPRETRAAEAPLASLDIAPGELHGGRTVELPVVYDGADLASLAAHLGMSAEALIDRHTSTRWIAGFGGFAPGFAYCITTADWFSVPRHTTPRTRVPAGSVALAGGFSAVYPAESPGGWQLIGRTPERMWDLDRESPALIRPGDEIVYRTLSPESVRVGSTPTESAPEATVASSSPAGSSSTPGSSPEGTHPALRLSNPGLLTLFQDLGRPGLEDLGVGACGAADTFSARQANRLLGNRPEAAVLENVLGGFSFVLESEAAIALTGAPAVITAMYPEGTPGNAVSAQLPQHAPLALPAGTSVEIGRALAGLRVYVGVRGGFAPEKVLGSVSTDLLSKLGPEPLVAGQVLARGPAPASAVGTAESGPAWARDRLDVLGRAHVASPTAASAEKEDRAPVVLHYTPGPRDAWFDEDAFATLRGTVWTVAARSDRVGLRLESEDAAVRATNTGQLPSEGVVTGALQVPPSGQPVLFLADHPVTGGYPVIATIVTADLDRAAQIAPGTRVRLAPAEDPTHTKDIHA